MIVATLTSVSGHTPAAEVDQQDEDFIGWQGEKFVADEVFDDSKHPWIETLSWEPRAYLYHNFLTAEEAQHIINLARPHMEKSQVVDSDTGGFVARTSSGFFLRRQQDDVVAGLEQRLAEWTKLPLENGEPFHVLHYEKGEQYTEHFDYFFDEINVQNGGQRVATVLLYLTDVAEGGETVFPHSKLKPSDEEVGAKHLSECGSKGVSVKPKVGDALLFWSLKPDGKTKDTKSLHAGCPVIKGDKWSATKWIRIYEHATA
eukprot:gene10978-11133_t